MAPRSPVIHARELTDLPVDEASRLVSHVLLLGHEDSTSFASVSPGLQTVIVAGDLIGRLFSDAATVGQPKRPQVGCLERGLPRALITANIVSRPSTEITSRAALHNWIKHTCEQVEVGFINYLDVVEGQQISLYKGEEGGKYYDRII